MIRKPAASGECRLTRILGPDRALRVHSLVLSDRRPRDLDQVDRAGGTDGMAHAQGKEKQFGGILLHYLKHNVERRVPAE